MKKISLVVILTLLLILPVVADVDTFSIKTTYGSPTDYTIDYDANTIAQVYNYSINSTHTLAANQSWLLLGSINDYTIDTLDQETGIAFTADVLQNFTVTSPGYYRYYYLVLNTGFYNPTTVLELKLYSDMITSPSPYVTVTPSSTATASVPINPAVKKESPPYQWVSDNLIWVVIALIVIVGLLVMRKR